MTKSVTLPNGLVVHEGKEYRTKHGSKFRACVIEGSGIHGYVYMNCTWSHWQIWGDHSDLVAEWRDPYVAECFVVTDGQIHKVFPSYERNLAVQTATDRKATFVHLRAVEGDKPEIVGWNHYRDA